MKPAPPEVWSFFISRARSHIKRITGYTLQSDKLVRHIIEQGDTGGYEQQTRRLAMLGDMTLRVAILHNWYPTERSVGSADFLLRHMASNERLAVLGHTSGIDSIIVDKTNNSVVRRVRALQGQETMQTAQSSGDETATEVSSGSQLGREMEGDPSIVNVEISSQRMATTVEAIFGAVYLDSGKDMAAVDSVLRTLRLHHPARNARTATAHAGASADSGASAQIESKESSAVATETGNVAANVSSREGSNFTESVLRAAVSEDADPAVSSVAKAGGVESRDRPGRRERARIKAHRERELASLLAEKMGALAAFKVDHIADSKSAEDAERSAIDWDALMESEGMFGPPVSGPSNDLP